MEKPFPTGVPGNSFERVRQNEKEYKERYKNIPASEPRLFSSETTEGKTLESPFVFPPIRLTITSEVIKSLVNTNQFTEFELEDLKLTKRLDRLFDDDSVLGDYEVTCCMRKEGDNNRIDKMIVDLDPDDHWQSGRLEHLLILSLSHPELFDSPVLALGSEIKQTGSIPRMQNRNGRIEYSNHPSAAALNSDCRFLIVRKV